MKKELYDKIFLIVHEIYFISLKIIKKVIWWNIPYDWWNIFQFTVLSLYQDLLYQENYKATERPNPCMWPVYKIKVIRQNQPQHV